MTPRLRRPNAVSVLLTGLLLAGLVSPCAAQLESPNPVPYVQRTDAFRRLLYEFRFTSVAQPGDSEEECFRRLHQTEPRETLLIVLGDPRCLSKAYFPSGLREFVRQGGAVLIATDKEVKDEEGRKNLIELAGVTVTGESIICPRPIAANVYQGEVYCPFVQPIPDSSPLGGSTNILGALATIMGAGARPALFHSSRPDGPDLRVATNAPSRLQERGWFGLPGGIHRLARLPAYCQVEDIFPQRLPPHPNFNGRMKPRMGGARSREMDEELIKGPLFAVGGTMGEGRVLVLADHSIFINRMILPRDNGNLEFAANCLHWLRGGASTPLDALKAANNPRGVEQLTGQRNKALFWDDGWVHKTFDVPMKTVPMNQPLASEPAIVAAIDQTLARMEDHDVFNQSLLDGLEDLPWTGRALARNALYAVTFAFLVVLFYRFVWRGRYRLDPAVPSLARMVAQHEPKASLLEQRRRAVLRAGNVWETAHELARQWFESAGIPLTADAAPRVATEGGWWRRWRISRRVARLWALARGTRPARVPPTALKRWLRELDELNSALANGTIRLT